MLQNVFHATIYNNPLPGKVNEITRKGKYPINKNAVPFWYGNYQQPTNAWLSTQTSLKAHFARGREIVNSLRTAKWPGVLSFIAFCEGVTFIETDNRVMLDTGLLS